jgi:hypothetical protein
MLWTDGVSQKLNEVQPGQVIPLEPPPQGGYVLYVGARVINIGACVEFRGRVRDPGPSKTEVGYDARGTTLVQHADGWGWPDPSDNSNVSNPNPCPDYGTADITGGNWELQMVVADRFSARTVEVVQPIVPKCMLSDAATQADCVCTCSANYFLGKCGMLDGGMHD